MLLSEELGHALDERAGRTERDPARAMSRLASIGRAIRASLFKLEDDIKAEALLVVERVPGAVGEAVIEFAHEAEEDPRDDMTSLPPKPTRHGLRMYLAAVRAALEGAYGSLQKMPAKARAAYEAATDADRALLRLPTGTPR